MDRKNNTLNGNVYPKMVCTVSQMITHSILNNFQPLISTYQCSRTEQQQENEIKQKTKTTKIHKLFKTL